MSKQKQFIIIGLLIGFLIATIGLIFILGIILLRNPGIVQGIGIIQKTVVVPETVIVEVTPTPTQIPSPTNTIFPQSKDRIVFLSVWEKDFYIINADGTDLARITNDGNHQYCPIWNPDGKRISFFVPSVNQGYFDMYIMDANGENRKFLFQAKLDTEYGQMPIWSPDGNKLAFTAYDATGLTRIYIYDGANIKRLTKDAESEMFPVWSPDGTKIAYTFSNIVNNKTFYGITSIDGVFNWLVSDLDANPFSPLTWSPDAQHLAFISGADLYIVKFFDIKSLDRRTSLISDRTFGPTWSSNGDTIAFYYLNDSCCSTEVNFLSASDQNRGIQSTHEIWAYQDSAISWSRDGRHVAVVGDANTKNWNIYIVDTAGNSVKLTDSDRRDHCPKWSP
jgi:TolB protein